ncbi:hypothetical protein OIY81_3079, partial [Cryptosporidium canis]
MSSWAFSKTSEAVPMDCLAASLYFSSTTFISDGDIEGLAPKWLNAVYEAEPQK